MFNDIFVGIMIVIAFAAGIWCWWFENYDRGEDSSKEEKKGGSQT